MLAEPLNLAILKSLAEGPRSQAEVLRIAGSPAQTTLRGRLRRLIEVGAIARHRRNRFPGALRVELDDAGRELLAVVGVLEHWLQRAPSGPLEPGSSAASAAIRALAEGWSTAMLRALAAGPRSLTEIDGLIASMSYPSLERRLTAMRLAGLVVPHQGSGRGTPYAVTDWAREGMSAMLAAIYWERAHRRATTTPLTRLDAEALFLLTVPRLRLSDGLAGACRLAIEIQQDDRRSLAGVTVEVEGARVVSCVTRLQGASDAWALGPGGAWLRAILQLDSSGLELGGRRRLAAELIETLHGSLFGDLDGRRIRA